MRTPAVVAIALVAAGIGLAVGSLIGGGRRIGAAPPAGEIEERNGALREQVADLRRRLDARRTAAPDSPTEPAPPPASLKPDEPPPGADPGADPGDARGARFFADAYEGALAEADWPRIAKNLRTMLEVVPAILTRIRVGEPPRPEDVGRVQQANGPLLAAALSLGDRVPGLGVNGKFTDPAFMVNAIASTLEAVDLPLTAEQAKGLLATAERYMAEDERRRRRYDDRTYEVEKLCEEVELKGRFFDDAFRLLTAEQAEKLSPAATRDRVRADLFSEALLYAGRLDVVSFADRDDLAEQIVARAVARIGLDEAQRATAADLIADWVNALPADLLAMETDALDREGMVTSGRATAWARQCVALLRGLSEVLALDDERREVLRGLGGVIVGIRK